MGCGVVREMGCGVGGRVSGEGDKAIYLMPLRRWTNLDIYVYIKRARLRENVTPSPPSPLLCCDQLISRSSRVKMALVNHRENVKGRAQIMAIGTANPKNCFRQADYPDYYFRVTKSDHLIDLKAKFKRMCKYILPLSQFHSPSLLLLLYYFCFVDYLIFLVKLSRKACVNCMSWIPSGKLIDWIKFLNLSDWTVLFPEPLKNYFEITQRLEIICVRFWSGPHTLHCLCTKHRYL